MSAALTERPVPGLVHDTCGALASLVELQGPGGNRWMWCRRCLVVVPRIATRKAIRGGA